MAAIPTAMNDVIENATTDVEPDVVVVVGATVVDLVRSENG